MNLGAVEYLVKTKQQIIHQLPQYLIEFWFKDASRMPDSPVEWQLLGNEMQLLNDISSLFNLEGGRERVGVCLCLSVRDRKGVR